MLKVAAAAAEILQPPPPVAFGRRAQRLGLGQHDGLLPERLRVLGRSGAGFRLSMEVKKYAGPQPGGEGGGGAGQPGQPKKAAKKGGGAPGPRPALAQDAQRVLGLALQQDVLLARLELLRGRPPATFRLSMEVKKYFNPNLEKAAKAAEAAAATGGTDVLGLASRHGPLLARLALLRERPPVTFRLSMSIKRFKWKESEKERRFRETVLEGARPEEAGPSGEGALELERRRKLFEEREERERERSARVQLVGRLLSLRHKQFPLGTRVWARPPGFTRWPGVIWSLRHCRRADMPALVESYRKGFFLVHFYGDHTTSWCKAEDIIMLDPNDLDTNELRFEAMAAWARKRRLGQAAKAVMEELKESLPVPSEELRRVKDLQESAVPEAKGSTDNVCEACGEVDALLECSRCLNWFHPMCLQPPVADVRDCPKGCWTCPACDKQSFLEEDTEEKLIRYGLTPDWIIEGAAFSVFGLRPPTSERPYIAGLLDPCTNSKDDPNIPAEKLYDKNDNGLKASNSWAGHYIVLNPEFKAQVQWRFINRAIDEVENDRVPGIVLVCRNSTDTAYFQRLTPYPRVLLRKSSVQFKDYEGTPIGFGIVVFCMAKNKCQDIYTRFYDVFAEHGEFNMPVDRTFMASPEFEGLLDRLKLVSSEQQRDNWILCSRCGKWRVVSYKECQEAEKAGDWTCKQLKGKRRGCHVEQTRAEVYGQKYMMYATRKEENELLAAYLEEDRFFEVDISDNEGSEGDLPGGEGGAADREKEGQSGEGEETGGAAPPGAGPAQDVGDGTNECVPAGRAPVPAKSTRNWFHRGHATRSRMARQLQAQSSKHREKTTSTAPVEVLTGAELARATRMAANRAMMERLGLSRPHVPGSADGGALVIPEIPEAATAAAEPIPEEALREALEDAHRLAVKKAKAQEMKARLAVADRESDLKILEQTYAKLLQKAKEAHGEAERRFGVATESLQEVEGQKPTPDAAEGREREQAHDKAGHPRSRLRRSSRNKN